jgi:hypothetical protein
MKKLLLLILFPAIMFSQSWDIKKDIRKFKIEVALDLTNSVRNHALLEPLALSSRLSKIASSRLDSISIKGEYIASLDDTGEIYWYTNRESKNHFKDAIIGLIVPGEDNFTYDQIVCSECTEVGFASAIIDDKTYTMLVFDKIY